MSAVLEPGLSLDKRQRAMLKEMGVQVWQPQPVVLPIAATVVVAAPVDTVAISSGAARAYIHSATGLLTLENRLLRHLKRLKQPPTQNHTLPTAGASANCIRCTPTLHLKLKQPLAGWC